MKLLNMLLSAGDRYRLTDLDDGGGGSMIITVIVFIILIICWINKMRKDNK